MTQGGSSPCPLEKTRGEGYEKDRRSNEVSRTGGNRQAVAQARQGKEGSPAPTGRHEEEKKRYHEEGVGGRNGSFVDFLAPKEHGNHGG